MLTETLRLALAGLATLLTFVAFLPYLRAVRAGTVRPHLFSWIVWGINTSLAFVVTWSERGGLGAWPVGVSAGVTLYVAWLAWRLRADVTLRPSDWGFLAASFAAMAAWLIASDAVWTIVLVTLTELLGFGPTFRKCWHAPRSESVPFYAILILRNALLIGALQTWRFTTLLFPLAMAGACVALIALMALRRARMGEASSPR
jgi:hypothetical protein